MNNTHQYKKLINYAIDNKIGIGFDSCSAPLFLTAVKDSSNFNRYLELAEPCESLLFSIYINTQGIMYPCSFLEEDNGIDMTKPDMELKDFWFAPSTNKWREDLLATAQCDTALVKGCRQCPKYNIY
jgi:MoaA/NifB/PqqE/SkfB family radical SAM enzyme